MSILTDFRTLGFVEQITSLDRVETERHLDAIPDLFDLCRAPLGDDTIDQAVRETLQALLALSETCTVAGLAADNGCVRALCARVAGEQCFASAAPVIAELTREEKCPDLLLGYLIALSQFESTENLPSFRQYLGHPNPLVAAQCIETVGRHGDEESIDVLCGVVAEAESDALFRDCSLSTQKAIEALGRIGGDRARAFLAKKIHHRNPTARRVIAQELVGLGAEAVPELSQVFNTGDVDVRILAANLLGEIKDKGSADVLVAAIDAGRAEDLNVRYAVYEALGEIASLKGLVCLMEGLEEEHEVLLVAVMHALNQQVSPPVVGRLATVLETDGPQRERLLKAIVASRAVELFRGLYPREEFGEQLVRIAAASGDPDVTQELSQLLQQLPEERAQRDAAKLTEVQHQSPQRGHRVLAVDDSRSMLLFYRSVLPAMELEVHTAGSGREALDRLETGEVFDLLITDLNMPVMDGVELVRRVRQQIVAADVPILMVTTESHGSQIDLARAAGVTDFAVKPLSPAGLAERVHELLG